MEPARSSRLLTAVAIVQGVYFLLTGVWPLVHIDSFEAITGEKIDDWLVSTVGVLVAVIGMVLLVAAKRRNFSFEIVVLAVGSAAALTGIDVYFVALGVIPPVYLADAVAELAIIAAWLIGVFSRDRSGRESVP